TGRSSVRTARRSATLVTSSPSGRSTATGATSCSPRPHRTDALPPTSTRGTDNHEHATELRDHTTPRGGVAVPGPAGVPPLARLLHRRRPVLGKGVERRPERGHRRHLR